MIERKSPFGVLEFDQWGFSIFGLGVHNYEQLRTRVLREASNNTVTEMEENLI